SRPLGARLAFGWLGVRLAWPPTSPFAAPHKWADPQGPRHSRDKLTVYETCCPTVRRLRSLSNKTNPGNRQEMRSITRRMMLAGSSGAALLACLPAMAQAPRDTDWLHYANDLSSTRYSPLEQINASNFNKLELAWKFSTNALGPRLDADYQSTPLMVKG